MSKQRENLFLIDGSGFIFRAYYALPPMMRDDGVSVHAVFGFCNILIKTIIDYNAKNILVLFDSPPPNFRHKMYSEYKAQRITPPEDLIPQIGLIHDATAKFGIKSEAIKEVEADDLIASYTMHYKKDYNIKIISSDKDLMQLLQYDNVSMIDPMKNKEIGQEDAIKKFGVTFDKIREVQTLCGDASDNIKGARGIGPKTAAKLITEFKTVKNLIENVEKIEKEGVRNKIIESIDSIKLSEKLVTLKDDIKPKITSFNIDANEIELREYLEKNNFSSIIKKLSSIPFLNLEPQSDDIPKFSIANGNKLIKDIKAKITKTNILSSIISDNNLYIYTEYDDNIIYQISKETGKNELKEIWENDGIKKVLFNAKQFMHDMDLNQNIKSIDDVMIIMYLLYSGIHTFDIETVLGRYDNNFLKIADNEKREGYKAISILKIYNHHYNLLQPEKLFYLYESIEKPMINILYKMEKRGIIIDEKKIKEAKKVYESQLEKIEKKIEAEAKEKFNIASPKEVTRVLADKLSKKTQKGNIKTDALTLEKLKQDGDILAGLILEHRKYAKLKSTYTTNLLEQTKNKALHTTYQMATVVTGRLASKNPNLQNIPIRTKEGRMIREAFVPRKGHKFVSFDYSQIELKILAHMGNVKKLIEEFQNKVDIHESTARLLFPFDDEGRAKAKEINFGIIYGMNAYGMSDRMNIKIEDAKYYIEKYFKKYPEIKNYMERAIETAKKNNYVTTIMNRKCYIQRGPNFERQAINAPIQGSQADIIKKAMIKIDKMIKKEFDKMAYILLQVHDELIFEISDKIIDQIIPKIKTIMEGAFNMECDLNVNHSIKNHW